jgi:hypothetical protein
MLVKAQWKYNLQFCNLKDRGYAFIEITEDKRHKSKKKIPLTSFRTGEKLGLSHTDGGCLRLKGLG